MFGALAQMLPDQVFACSDGGNTGISIGGWDADRRPFIYVDFTCCAWGGRPYADGLDGNSNIYANMASQSIEVTETEQPIAITAYEFIPDAMGPGKFRGGAPFRRDYRFPGRGGRSCRCAPIAAISDLTGSMAAAPGKPSMNYLNPDTENRPLPSKLTMTIRRGDIFPPRGRRCRRLGRPAGARPGDGVARCQKRARLARLGARGLRCGIGRKAASGRRCGDASSARAGCAGRATGRRPRTSVGSRPTSRSPRNRHGTSRPETKKSGLQLQSRRPRESGDLDLAPAPPEGRRPENEQYAPLRLHFREETQWHAVREAF